MRSGYYMLLVMSATALTGCVSHWDMQGHNPKEYYAKNPIENKVETRFITQKVDFTSSETIAEDRKAIHAQLAQISVSAIDSVEIQVHPNQLRNLSRNEQLRKMLTKAGIKKTMITYVAAEDVSPSEANILIAHAAVVSPRCPDWRSASVTSYSNARYTGNISCATRTNLGLMVADPHDLVEGSGNERPDTNSATKAIQNYRSSQSSSAESTDGAESAGASTTGQ